MDSSTFTAGPQLRFHNSTSSEITAWQQLPLKAGVDRTSYYIVKDSESGSNVLKLSSGDFEDGNHGDPDLIVGIHVQSSSTIFIESLQNIQDVRLAREIKSKFSRPVKRELPCSKPPKERTLVLLDSDATIFVNKEIIYFKIGTFPLSLTPDGEDVTMEEDEPQVLVQQSHPQELLKRGESDMVQSTPVIPETVTEEPRVYETPSVKSRFMNPDIATVTLARGGIPREDTFRSVIDEGDNPTLKRNNSAFARSPLKDGLLFGSHSQGRSDRMTAVGDLDLTSDEEEVGKGKSLDKKFDRIEVTPRKGNRSTAPVAMMGDSNNVISLEDTEDEEKENRRSAEAMRRRFSESAMITSFGSAINEAVSEATPPAVEQEEEEETTPINGANTPRNHIKKHGIPEGFMYEEHKKDTTPRQVYGKNKRKTIPVPKEKQVTSKGRASNETVISINDSEDELLQNPQVKKRRLKRTREINATDESEEEVEVLPRGRKGVAPSQEEEEEDTTMEAGDDEDEIVPPPRTQRGRRTVQSIPSTAATTEDDVMRPKNYVRRKKPAPTKKARKATGKHSEGSDIEELTPTAKPTEGTRGRRGAKKPSDIPDKIFSTAPEEAPEELPRVSPEAKLAQSIRKRRRTEDIDEDVEDENSSLPTTREGTAESTVQVAEQPKQKRTKMTPVKKAPSKKRGKMKDETPPESSGKLLGDTQYTIQVTQTQTQTLNQTEAKTPKVTKKKATPPARKSSARKKKVGSQTLEIDGDGEGEEADEASGGGTRTKKRYDGDVPKIVFSNSGLDERKDIEKFLRANGGKKMQNVSAPGVNFLVVGPGELKRTPKLTVGVALGKYIVEDQWLIDSKEIGYFLDPDQYTPYDPTHEKAWSFSLTAAITRGRKGLNCILKDHNVYITSSLLSQLKASKQEDSLVEMLKAAGVGTITKRSPKVKREDDKQAEQTLILGTEKGDSDVGALENAGWTVYGTGIVAISVLRGKLDVGDEFRIPVPEMEIPQKLGRGRKGK